MTEKKTVFNLSLPRRMYYSEDVGLEKCPECHGALTEKRCSIMMHAKCAHDEGDFMTNLPGGYFCGSCPVVVFDSSRLKQAAMMGLKDNYVEKYHPFGIVDLDKIPEEKRHLEMGTDANPIPLVRFLPALQVENSNNLRKIGRNDPCTCGSGKKYKKCCGE